MPILTPEEYRQRASQVYDPGYQIKVANENNAYNSGVTQYNQQIGTVNSNFDKSVQTIERNTALTQNQYSNNNLGRGLGRSTIASTGIAGIANTGTRLTAEADQAKTQQINDLETLKTTLKTNLNSTLNALASERESGINNMAVQFQQRDEDIQRQMDQEAENKRRYEEQMAWEKQKYADAQAAAQLAASKKSSSGGAKKTTPKTPVTSSTDYSRYLSSAKAMISNEKSNAAVLNFIMSSAMDTASKAKMLDQLDIQEEKDPYTGRTGTVLSNDEQTLRDTKYMRSR